MKIALLTLFVISSFCYALPRGTTQDAYPDGGIVVGHAKQVTLHNESLIYSLKTPSERDSWVPVDSLHFDTILRPGSYMSLQYNPLTVHATPVSNLGELIPESITAIHKAPSWLRPDLENVLNQLTPAKQEIWAGIIIDANDPYIDEIAFSIAHSSVQYLSSSYANPQLMVENATMIYQVALDLPYVDVVDHASSTEDYYYSTTRYRKMNADSTISYVEVPRDIYYWYIVHPKITDEVPAYIDPAIVESNSSHINNITAPPTGQFWRSFLYSATQDSLPVLSTVLANCQTVRNWNGAAGDAITAIQGWINGTMGFTSNSERPHQPVRIYQKHIGRCGEYADYTAAATRTALIPCTSILSSSTDHTWNEFWDEDWVQWEPVNGYINVPMVYENGWGKVFGSVFSIRSDGFLDAVTDRYSEGLATISVTVVDSMQNPVDGARILLMMDDAGTLKFDMMGLTGNNGICVFPVGENRHFVARVDTPIGSTPILTGQYLELIDNTVNGISYEFEMSINNIMPGANVNLMDPPSIDSNYRLVTDLNVGNEILSGTVMWDDITSSTTRPIIYKMTETAGNGNFMLLDSDNFMFYQISLIADVYAFSSVFSQMLGDYDIPSTSEWYACIDNLHHIRNAQYITGSVRLEQYVVGNDDPTAVPDEVSLDQNYPNPFNPSTVISFQLPFPSQVNLSIYNVKGQKVKTLLEGQMESGKHKITWNGTDGDENPVSSGVYFYRLDAGNKHYSQKMILLK